jgi:hypothetical protein
VLRSGARPAILSSPAARWTFPARAAPPADGRHVGAAAAEARAAATSILAACGAGARLQRYRPSA